MEKQRVAVKNFEKTYVIDCVDEELNSFYYYRKNVKKQKYKHLICLMKAKLIDENIDDFLKLFNKYDRKVALKSKIFRYFKLKIERERDNLSYYDLSEIATKDKYFYRLKHMFKQLVRENYSLFLLRYRDFKNRF